jgi:hypothetical protein
MPEDTLYTNELLESDDSKEKEDTLERNQSLEEEAHLLEKEAQEELKKLEEKHTQYIRRESFDPKTVSEGEKLLEQGQLLFVTFITKTKQIVQEKYQEHAEKKLSNSLANSFKKFTEKIHKLHELPESAKSEKEQKKVDAFFTKLPGELLPYLLKYKNAEKYTPRNWLQVEEHLRFILDQAIETALKKKDVDTALILWRYYPATPTTTSGPTRSIVVAVMGEVGANGREISNHLLKRLKDFPDLLLDHINSLSRARHERDIEKGHTEALLQCLAQMRTSDAYKGVDHSFPLSSLGIADELNSGELSKSSIDSETRKQLFAAKNHSNRERVLEHVDLFQEDIDSLSQKDRKEFLENMTLSTTYNYGNDYVGITALLSYCQVTEREYGSLFNKFNSQKNWRFTQDTFIQAVERETPLALITNAKSFGLDAEAQNIVLKNIAEGKGFYKRVHAFEQVLSRREKYLEIDFQKAEKLFTQIIEESLAEMSTKDYIYLSTKQFSQIVSDPELKSKLDSLVNDNLFAQMKCILDGYEKKLFSEEQLNKIHTDILDRGGLKEIKGLLYNSDELGFTGEEVTMAVRRLCNQSPRDGFELLLHSEWRMGEILKTLPQGEVEPIFQSVIASNDLKGVEKILSLSEHVKSQIAIPDSIFYKGIELLADNAPEKFYSLLSNGTIRPMQVDTLYQQLSQEAQSKFIQNSEVGEENQAENPRNIFLNETAGKHPALDRVSKVLEKIEQANPDFAAPSYIVSFFAQHPENEEMLDMVLTKFPIYPKALIPTDFVSTVFARESKEKAEYVFDTFNKYMSRSREHLGIRDVPWNKLTQRFLEDRVKMLALMDKVDEADAPLLSDTLRGDLQVNLSEMSEAQRENLDEKNWATALLAYISVSEEHRPSKLTDEYKQKVLEQFSTGGYRDTVLASMQDAWKNFLSSESLFLPLKLSIVGHTVEAAGGAGNLKHVESLGNLVEHVRTALAHEKVTQKTKEELKNLLSSQEARMERDKWSEDDRSLFYGLSVDILQAAPSLYTTFSPVLESLSPKEMKLFMSETFPLYQAQLVTVQTETKDNGDVSYNPRDLVIVRAKLKEMVGQLKSNPLERVQLLTTEKTRLLEEIKEKFKNRFGITHVPEEFGKEEIRLVQNNVRYLGNIADRNSTKEAIIAFYLSLGLSHKWEDFRQGKVLAPEEYLSGNGLAEIKPILEERAKSFLLPLEIAGIPDEKKDLFQEILQEDVVSNMMGNIKTIDVKLGEVKRNIETLADPDVYTEAHEKDILALFDKEGKSVGTVLAKTYSQVTNKQTNFGQEEIAIQSELARIFTVSNWTPEKVKEIQNTIQPFNLISNVVTKVREERVDENIRELAERLVPSERIIEIFKRLGEDFSQESGALALAKDVSYLENLVVKDEQKLTSDEKQEVEAYLNSIREKLKDLETAFAKITEYFEKIKKSAHNLKHQLLKNRLEEIEKIIYSKDSNEMIVSRMTKDLNLVIENMRQCLGCLRKEINNDTNLSFGDYNKFFLMSQGEKEKGSISDEILFFAPLKISDTEQEMSFVMDRVYGSTSGDVLVSNILSVFKKYQKIKKEIPEAKISIAIPDNVIRGVGLDQVLLKDRLQKAIPELARSEFMENLLVNIPASSLSDNYVEFGIGGARQSGERAFSGLVLG